MVREDDEYETRYSVGLFSLDGLPLSEEDAAAALAWGGDIFAEVMRDGEWVALVRISAESGEACVLWEEARMSEEAAELAVTRLLQEWSILS